MGPCTWEYSSLGRVKYKSFDGPISQNSNSSIVFSSSVNFEASKMGSQNLVLDNPNNDFGGGICFCGSISLADIGSLILERCSDNDFTVSVLELWIWGQLR